MVDLEDVLIADIAAGGWHSLALTTDGGTRPPMLVMGNSAKAMPEGPHHASDLGQEQM